MPSVTVELSAYCSRCGAGICRNVEIDKNMNINIDPCEACLANEYDKGHGEGYELGYNDGYDHGQEALDE